MVWRPLWDLQLSLKWDRESPQAHLHAFPQGGTQKRGVCKSLLSFTSKWGDVYHLHTHRRGKKLNDLISCLKTDDKLCMFAETDVILFLLGNYMTGAKVEMYLWWGAVHLSPGLAIHHLRRSFLGRWVDLLLWSVNTLVGKCCCGWEVLDTDPEALGDGLFILAVVKRKISIITQWFCFSVKK